MARSKTLPPRPEPPLAIKVPRVTAQQRIQNEIARGEQLLLQVGKAQPLDWDDVKAAKEKWGKFVGTLLAQIFTNSELKREFDDAGERTSFFFGPGGSSFADIRSDLAAEVRGKIHCLESILERLDLLEESGATIAKPLDAEPYPDGGTKIFVVHGHDSAARLAVSRFIEAIGFTPIVLHEQVNHGASTIIEKIERHSDVQFAVVLLTPDDLGRAADEEALRPRARQNVLAELGYFVGRLTRQRVMALRKGDVEVPSDFSGVIYTEMDEPGRWKIELARELEAAGYAVDFGKAAKA